ncbi:prephenate dehydrogenase [Macrococcus equipercicus]|uniref:Prephenate dehydrogenase n=1 Tax=Macrococcus equipercicus TaxID=69967 RepID=A0ABQ6R6W8_9STAP|nr:prephenate dehydrogenase [Macrococcus equipercicus]KAA1037593.1 prephenate dehydrogenase [Macrococcus equipercicus]
MNIAIVGLGVIGGTFAKAIRSHNEDHRIMAIDTNLETLKLAQDEGFIDHGETVNKTVLQQADLVIFALYPEVMKEYVRTHQNDFKAGAIITDTTGVKRTVIASMADVIPEQVDFIFGHPMAGREKRGFEYADASVFEGANYVITPTDRNKQENIDWFKDFLSHLGFKRVTMTDANTHDEMIAHTSQLTHAIAVALINSDDRSHETIRFIGDSYRDLTRIANMNEKLWPELFMNNKDHLITYIERFEEALRELKTAIQDDDAHKMEQIFKESTARRVKLQESDLRVK